MLDGAAVVHFLSIGVAKTFVDYSRLVFIPYIIGQLRKCSRVDVVWDTYIENSVKESARDKRGVGTRMKVTASAKMPLKWADFLKDPTNKKELFDFLTSQVANFKFNDGKQVIITAGEVNYNIFYNYIFII